MSPAAFDAHFQAAAGAGRLPAPTHAGSATDAACGDRLSIELTVVAGVVRQLAWTAEGCAATLAVASALATLAPGRPATAGAFERGELDRALGLLPPTRRHVLGLAIRAFEAAATTRTPAGEGA